MNANRLQQLMNKEPEELKKSERWELNYLLQRLTLDLEDPKKSNSLMLWGVIAENLAKERWAGKSIAQVAREWGAPYHQIYRLTFHPLYHKAWAELDEEASALFGVEAESS